MAGCGEWSHDRSPQCMNGHDREGHSMAGSYRVTKVYPNGSLRITNGQPGVVIVVGFLGYVTHASPEGLACMASRAADFREETDTTTGRARHVFTGRLEGAYRVPGRGRG